MGRANRLKVWVRGRRQPRRRVFTTPRWLHESRLVHAMKWLDRGGRGHFLICFGLIYIVLGQSYLTSVHPAALDALRGTRFMPLAGWGAVWVAAGVVAVISGLLYSPAKDRWGFLCLNCLAFWWGLSYGAAWLFDGLHGGWRTAVVYWAFSAAALIMSGMIDPATVDRMKAHDQERYADGEYPRRSS